MSNNDVDYICVDFSEEELNEIIEEMDKIISNYYGDSEVLANAYLKKGTAYAGLKKHKEAIDDFSNAIKYGSDEFKKSTFIFPSRGREYTEMGDYKNAIDDFSKSLRLNPDQAAILLFRGNVYHLIGEKEKAKADFDEYKNRKHKKTENSIRLDINNLFSDTLVDICKEEALMDYFISEEDKKELEDLAEWCFKIND
jgi:tetratricopeptide (TPR) repeat protein